MFDSSGRHPPRQRVSHFTFVPIEAMAMNHESIADGAPAPTASPLFAQCRGNMSTLEALSALSGFFLGLHCECTATLFIDAVKIVLIVILTSMISLVSWTELDVVPNSSTSNLVQKFHAFHIRHHHDLHGIVVGGTNWWTTLSLVVENVLICFRHFQNLVRRGGNGHTGAQTICLPFIPWSMILTNFRKKMKAYSFLLQSSAYFIEWNQTVLLK